MRFLYSFFSFFALLSFLRPAPVFAASDSLKTPHVQVQMVSETSAIQPGRPFEVGFEFKIIKGWHTYWQNPGDSGEAPRLKWAPSSEYSGGSLQFPTPKRIEIPPLANFGYSDEVFHTAQVKPSADLKEGQRVILKADLNWLVCEETCIPEKGSLELSLPVSLSPAPAEEALTQRFEEARKKIPDPGASRKASLSFKGKELVLSFKDSSSLPEGSLNGSFFPATGGVIENAAPQELRKTKQEILLKLQKSDIQSTPLKSLSGLVSLNDASLPPERRVFWIEASAQESSSIPWKALPFALVGGLLLNLMPCVFPVLSIKVLSFVKKSADSPSKIFRHGLAYTFGVLASFWILAAALFLIKLTGKEIGWGFQLQSPVFLMVLSLLLFFMGLSLLGLFELGDSLMGMGQSLAGKGGYSGSFFTGVLATVVATPCVAPFMGPALAAALSQPGFFSFLIFSALGLGLALPYLALCLHPAWLRLLPKPGPWMETFKQAMAFPLFGTVIWLLWVFSLQTSPSSLIWALAGLLVLSFGTWAASRIRPGTLKKGVAGLAVMTALGVGFFGIERETGTRGTLGSEGKSGLPWMPYSPESLEDLLKQGKPVFLNFTAAWCITCQVNERVALRSEEVIRRFQEKGVTLLKADWTNPDEVIARELKRFGREGVPLYVLYGKGDQATQQILPQILTPNLVLEALEKIQ